MMVWQRIILWREWCERAMRDWWKGRVKTWLRTSRDGDVGVDLYSSRRGGDISVYVDASNTVIFVPPSLEFSLGVYAPLWSVRGG